MKRLTHNLYLQKLQDNDIKIMPTEKYIDNRTKIMHRCFCGNEWMIAPEKVLIDRKCGCKPRGFSIETYRNRKTILYYIKVDSLWKIGISIWETYKTPEENILKGRYRHKNYKRYNIEVISYKVYEDGAEAFLKEKQILDEYDDKRYMHTSEDMNNFVGYTELFSENIQLKIKD